MLEVSQPKVAGICSTPKLNRMLNVALEGAQLGKCPNNTDRFITHFGKLENAENNCWH